MNRALLITLISVGVIFLGGMITLAYFMSKGPETYIYKTREIPTSFRKEMEDLDLITEDEHLVYFYSDGLFDIKDGLYALTDKHLILYSTQWSEPETIIAFNEISYVDFNYDASVFLDSYVRLETHDGLKIEFPLSSERGRDREFYELLYEKVKQAS